MKFSLRLDICWISKILTAAPPPLQGNADGELYLDDGHSFSYRDRKAFCLRRFSMLSGRLLCR